MNHIKAGVPGKGFQSTEYLYVSIPAFIYSVNLIYLWDRKIVEQGNVYYSFPKSLNWTVDQTTRQMYVGEDLWTLPLNGCSDTQSSRIRAKIFVSFISKFGSFRSPLTLEEGFCEIPPKMDLRG